MSTNHLTLTPAYGRDYRSKDAVLKAWNAGKDFILHDITDIHDGKPINKPQVEEILKCLSALTLSPAFDINIRYNKLQRVVVISAYSSP